MKREEKFIKYENLLKEWSTKMNLVAPSTLTDIQTRHIQDSAQLAKYLPKDVKPDDEFILPVRKISLNKKLISSRIKFNDSKG